MVKFVNINRFVPSRIPVLFGINNPRFEDLRSVEGLNIQQIMQQI